MLRRKGQKMRTKRYNNGKEVEMDFGGSSGTGEYAPTPEKDTEYGDLEGAMERAKAAPKPRIVTKEQLEKSGYSNLRDFLNAERGLKRRDGSAPERKAPEVKPAPEPKPPAPKAEVKKETPVKATEEPKKDTQPKMYRDFQGNMRPVSEKEKTDWKSTRLNSSH